jgi:ZIP family zinc transporter
MQVTTAIAAAAVTGLCTVLGALPVLGSKRVGRRFYDAVLGFGAGLMIAAATLGMIGHALAEARGRSVPLLVLGFFAGVAVMYLMERFIPHLHAHGHSEHGHTGHGEGHEHAEDGHAHGDHDHAASRKGYLIATALFLHRVPEGFAIGAGFLLGEGKLGVFLALALSLQNICEGMVLAVPLRRGGASRRRTLVTVLLTGLSTPAAAAAGLLLLSGATAWLPVMLALAAGALLFLVLAEILPESHGHGNESLASLTLAIGFGVSILVHLLVEGHH